MTSLLTFHENPPLSLYVHLPWCVRKCPYCDFNSHESGHNALKEKAYVEALIRDLETELPGIWGRRINTVFIGGGTPSLFSTKAIAGLLAELRARLNFYPDTEITLEANPGTAEAGKFTAFRKTGINRLSLGVQSFENEKLKRLGRIHDAEEARAAIRMAKSAGFEEINIDLMFGLPGQTVAQALSDLLTAIDHEPQHISWYQLTIEPNTVFYSRPPQLPEDDLIWEMQEHGQALLKEHGYLQYEISAYAKTKHQCLHNLNYWQFGDYLGIGAGAHGKLTDVTAGKVTRKAKHRIPDRFIELAGTEAVIGDKKILRRDDLTLEFMMNVLRLNDGVHPSLFMQRTGLPLAVIQSRLEAAEAQGLIEWNLQTLRPTAKGRRYLNDLLQIFMPEVVIT
jgi:putative oxygen-independent coproporphyrinogen III oxidase